MIRQEIDLLGLKEQEKREQRINMQYKVEQQQLASSITNNNYIKEESDNMQVFNENGNNKGLDYYGKQDDDQVAQEEQQDSQQDKSTSKTSPQLAQININLEDSIYDSSKGQKRPSSVHAYMNLFKGYIGSGILALPYAFNQAGWILSTLIFLLVAHIVYETMALLFELADSFNKEGIDYQFLAKHHFGRKGQFTVNFFLIIFQIGCCISYVIFFIKFLENVFSMAGQSEGNNDFVFLLIALAIIIPMSFINSISAFAKISIAANFMVIVTLLAIFSYNIQRIQNLSDDQYSKNINQQFDFTRIPMMIGVSIYAFEAIGLIFSIRNSVENPQQEFGTIFKRTNIVMVSLYIVFSVIAAIAYGSDINEIILFNLPNDESSVKFFQIMYGFALIMSYPLQLLPCFKIIEQSKKIHRFIYRDVIEESSGNERCSVLARRMILRILFTLCICLCAFAIPRFAVFLNIIGALAGTSLQFVLPIIMYLQTFKDSIQNNKKYKLYFYFSIGIIGGASSFIFSVIELFKSREGEQSNQ